jgi:hypothetical protein
MAKGSFRRHGGKTGASRSGRRNEMEMNWTE